MRVIYKYHIFDTEKQDIVLPEGSKILTVQMQQGQPVFWALVSTQNAPATERFYVFGTGHPIHYEIKMEYINTFQIDNLVFHVFKELK